MNRYHLAGLQKVTPWMAIASFSKLKCTKWVKNLRVLYGTVGFHGGRNPVSTAMVLPSCLGCSHRRQILRECPVQHKTEPRSSSSRQGDLTDNLFSSPLHQSHCCPSVCTVPVSRIYELMLALHLRFPVQASNTSTLISWNTLALAVQVIKQNLVSCLCKGYEGEVRPLRRYVKDP